MNMSAEQIPVLIVGAGPVGLVMALDLARRGVRSLVVERRPAGAPPSVKCNHVSARSMETFRRLGVSKTIRQGGLPADYPNDCVYRTSVTSGFEITRVPIPALAERGTGFESADALWPTPEPPYRINQIYLEPIIYAHAQAQPLITILDQTEVIEVTQGDDSARATLRNISTGSAHEATARYIVGCDGGRSMVRTAIGAKLHGDAVVQRVQSTYIRAPKLLALMQGRVGWMNLALNPRRSGNLIAIDGKELWLIHSYLYEHEEDFDAIDRDEAIRTILGVGADFEYEIISNEDWIGRRLVADRFRDRRIFICGDASHLWVPYAGYGMNAGIADAMNLSWLLAATINGWGGPQLLDAYEAERLPITEQVSYYAMNHALGAIAHRRDVPTAVERDDAIGEEARLALGRSVYDHNVRQYCCGGLNFGYFYDESHVIAYDGEQPPGYSMDGFTPSTVPGCRTPHFWRNNGRSAYDDFGPEYTLLRFDPSIDVEPLVKAARERGLPLEVLDLLPDERTSIYREQLVLSRPDLHIAWRGNRLPDNALELIDQVRGA